MTQPRIAFFGLGTMGMGMSRRLLKAGYSLTVYNRNQEKAAPLAAEGARVAATPREAAKDADILIAMLADNHASRAVWLGEDGALAAARPGAICIDGTTATVQWVRELAGIAHSRGLKFLDAPVTGTKPHAENGELTFLVGGDAAVLEAVRPVLAHMSKEILHLGPVGAGAALKLINNFMCGVQAAALAEAFIFLDRSDIDPAKALPLLLSGAPGSPLIKTLTTRHTTGDPTIYFQLSLMAKDLTYAISEARQHHLDLKTAAAALERFNQAVAAGDGDKDLSAIIGFHRRRPV